MSTSGLHMYTCGSRSPDTSDYQVPWEHMMVFFPKILKKKKKKKRKEKPEWQSALAEVGLFIVK